MVVNQRLLITQIIGMFVVFALTLFLSAGTVAWAAGWTFLALFFSFVIVQSVWLLRHNPALLTERMTGIGKADQKSWDKVFLGLASLLFFTWLVVMPLDAVRFHWSQTPTWLQAAGAILLLASFRIFFLTFRENSYLSPAVRVQTDRAQTVVSTGPYCSVRHPMYAAAILMLFGATLLLGSLYGLVLALIIAASTAFRAMQEERTLQAELLGYSAYMAQVKHRLIPYIW